MKVLRRGVLVAAVAVAGIVVTASPAVAVTPPSSMASMGDSITRGFDACGWYIDCPADSYSTGTSSTVRSQYLRLEALNPAITGHNYNDAKTGAVSGDMYGQAGTAVSQAVQYVTMLIGANDACKSSTSAMTPVTTFRANIDAALNRLKSGLPNAHVEVISIPDIYRLWYVGHTNLAAISVWSIAGICQSMLANPLSTSSTDTARRLYVRQRVIDYNTQLAQACAAYGANCKFDNDAVFNYPFVLSQISTWDYFHPNPAGQAVLASLSFTNGFTW